ncbi:polysaccharide deacetylase family protein [Jiulongibacter sp. NS-SX5]|uniref:polysaccharide deacetylase family protein n=1 Tax=Jiulongibacter sp. NS-SX5 TaxID=3463854 RepID=UPI004057DC24
MKRVLFLFLCLFAVQLQAQTYAEKLGFPKGSKVLILHIDDVGMSFDSNKGAIEAIENGVANSLSMMMPCPWISGFLPYLKANPETDAGLHLTLTSEWSQYRWGPLAGKPEVPGLVDNEGALWPSVAKTAGNASPDEIESEIRAQLDRSRTMGWEPTHLDSHMGTLFARPDYLERYIKVGMEEGIPVMFPGGHNSMIMKTTANSALDIKMTTAIGQKLWNAGLPVLDDLHNVSYDWKGEDRLTKNDLQVYKTEQYMKTIDDLEPGITMVIMHCTWPTEVFKEITDSGKTREGDMLAMTDPKFKAYLEQENIILTTWRELKNRRDQIK